MLVIPATAHAAWLPATPIDGPNADVLSVGNIDIARDGAGAVAYLRLDGGVPHAFISRMFGGAWRGPERVDGGLGAATEVKVAVGDDNRIAVVWIADGNVYANVAPGGPTAPSGFTGAVAIGGPDARSLDIDLGHQRRRVRGLGAGRRRARRAPAGRDVDRRWRRRSTSIRTSRPAPARCGRRSPSPPRATRSRPGATGPATGPRGSGAGGSPA